MPSRTLSAMDDHDPLTKAISPPPDETAAEKEARVKSELEAKRVSDAIDDDIDKQRIAEKRGPKPVRVLLLGQSESGKSTTLKNFQLMQDAKAFRKERSSWRALIQLNLVRSIHIILDAIARDYYPSSRPLMKDPNSSSTSPSVSPPSHAMPLPKETYLDPELLELRLRLDPLWKVQEQLARRLMIHESQWKEGLHGGREVVVNSAVAWKDVFTKKMANKRESSDSGRINWDDPTDPGRVLHECAEDMKRLWKHPLVQNLLEKQNLRLEEMAGFFLDEIDEITSEYYIPTNDHILKARLKTLGVSEHRVELNAGGGLGRDWRIYDVGGHRSLTYVSTSAFLNLRKLTYHQTATWVPYFDNVDAIIFLAPISAFDQVLEEAPKVNRLEDSVMLWSSIVSNKLLERTDIILFLNKCDIMKTKLSSGIRLKDYVVSYGNRPNDFDSAASYLKKKFAGIMKEDSPLPRTFYCHLTTVTDTLSTQKVITSIKDMLMRDNLKHSTLLL